MPRSIVRLSAGRTAMSDETQALCFFAGANSIFVGDTLLTRRQPRRRHATRRSSPSSACSRCDARARAGERRLMPDQS